MNDSDLNKIVGAIRRCFVRFNHVERTLAMLEELVASDWSVAEPPIILLIGDPGTGKSWILRRFAADHPSIRSETETKVPVLLVTVPPKCSLGQLPSAMLLKLGSPLWNIGSEQQRTEQLHVLLKACGVRLVILNEANHLIDRGREKSHYLLADWVKVTSEETHIPFVLAGIPRLNVLLSVNEQLADRVTASITIQPFSADPNCENRMEVALRPFDKLLGPIDRIKLTDPEVAKQFVFASAGRLRKLRQLFVRSVEIAGSTRKLRIDGPVLAEAFRTVVFKDAPNERNPFVPEKFNGLPLNRRGEPYDPRRPLREEVDA